MFQNSIRQHLSCCFSLDFLTLIHFVNHSSFFKLDTEHWGQSPIVVTLPTAEILSGKNAREWVSMDFT